MKHFVYEMNIVDGIGMDQAKEYDFFVLAAGSDKRAFEIMRKCSEVGVYPKSTVLFHFNERKPTNVEDAYYAYKKLNIPLLREIDCSIKSAVSSLEPVIEHIETNANMKIAIDISCFTKPYFFYLIKLFKERYSIRELDVFYTEPQSYIFPKGLFKSYHSSSGPLTVREISGYNGIEVRNAKRILIILLGFDGDISQEINVDVSPNEAIVVNGFPGYAPKFKDISLANNEKLTTDPDIKVLYSRANNPFEVYNLLEKVKKSNDGSFLNIAPLGTKPMALGACLFAIHNPDVRVVYPVPDSYVKITTEDCVNSWRYRVSLLMS